MHRKNNISLNKVRTNHATLITEIEHKQVGVIPHVTHTHESPDALLDAFRQFVK